MRACAGKSGLIRLTLVALLVVGMAPGAVFADDKASSDSSTKAEKTETAKPVTSKADPPAPLTERERWLLDRVEQLEKRVAELESKSNAKAASSREGSSAQAIAAQPAPPDRTWS